MSVKKVLALDLGDAWVGIAVSDPMKMFARPLKTVAAADLHKELIKVLQSEPIEIVVIGLPVTVGGGKDSDQTRKIRDDAAELEKYVLSQIEEPMKWVLWDERLSSKRAAEISRGKKIPTKEEKLMEHAKAAAFVLQTYLDYLSFLRS